MALRPDRPQSRTEQLAKREAAEKDVLLREVDEALREDEMRTLFQRFGKPVGAAVLLGLVALGGYLFWNETREREAGERGEQFTMALDRVEAGNLDAADKQLATILTGNGAGSTAAAKLMQAGIALQQNKTADALRLFNAVAADDSAPQPLRDLATVRNIATSFDTLPVDSVIARLKPLAVPGNPWFASAGELLGLAYLKQGNTKLAGPLFAAIARDQESPETLRSRARQMAGTLGYDAVDDPEAALREDSGRQPQ